MDNLLQLKTLETQNKTHAESIEEKNKLLADFSERIQTMKDQGFGASVTMGDIKELRTWFGTFYFIFQSKFRNYFWVISYDVIRL